MKTMRIFSSCHLPISPITLQIWSPLGAGFGSAGSFSSSPLPPPLPFPIVSLHQKCVTKYLKIVLRVTRERLVLDCQHYTGALNNTILHWIKCQQTLQTFNVSGLICTRCFP